MKKTKRNPFPKDIPDERFTPPGIVRELHRIYRFDVDAFSHPRAFSAKIIGTHWTKRDDAFAQRWDRRLFCQPPYSILPKCFAFGFDAWRSGLSPLQVWLVPNWTDREWWHRFVEPFRDRVLTGPLAGLHVSTRNLPGRLTFANPRSLTFEKKNQAKFGMTLITYKGRNDCR